MQKQASAKGKEARTKTSGAKGNGNNKGQKGRKQRPSSAKKQAQGR